MTPNRRCEPGGFGCADAGLDHGETLASRGRRTVGLSCAWARRAGQILIRLPAAHRSRFGLRCTKEGHAPLDGGRQRGQASRYRSDQSAASPALPAGSPGGPGDGPALAQLHGHRPTGRHHVDPTLGGPGLANARDLLAATARVVQQNNAIFGISGAAVDVIVVALNAVMQQRCPSGTEHHGRAEVGRVDLSDELPAPPARRKDVQAVLLVSPYRHDGADVVLPGSYHHGDRAGLGAEAGPAPGVDADPAESVA